MSREIPNTREIKAFMHCAQCLKESQPQNIEAGWTALGFQVWCRTHDANIAHVDFEGQKHPANTSRKLTDAEQAERKQREAPH
jgi:hypothetical protein